MNIGYKLCVSNCAIDELCISIARLPIFVMTVVSPIIIDFHKIL